MFDKLANIAQGQTVRSRYTLAFIAYWSIVFLLYLPAARAGRVGDFPGWVTFLNSVSFTDYINRKGSGIPSLYQFTQVVTWFFYKLFGVSAWLWHLLYITMQAINALLLYSFFKKLFIYSEVKFAAIIAFSGALLFCVTPYISEVVVWEPSFHYLLALMMMLGILVCTQNFLYLGKSRYAWLAGLLFFLSSYSLEIFYLTPLFTLSYALHFYFGLKGEKERFKSVLKYIVLPQATLFLLHFLVLKARYHEGIAHIGSMSLQFSVANCSKGLKYVFHIVGLGRFLPMALRKAVYEFCETGPGLAAFYATVAATIIYIAIRYKKMKPSRRVTVLVFAWCLASLALILPLSFPDLGLVILDRYTYLLDAFIYMLILLLAGQLAGKRMLITFVAIYCLVLARYTHRANAYWRQSAEIVDNLINTFPNDTTKKVLLLSLPECLDGVQMVGTRDDGEFRMMYNALKPVKITNAVHDVEAFYMSSPADGAHVTVLDDKTARVTLNQWGTWWLYYGMGATSYQNADYKVNMKDPGHLYEITLKHPAGEYLLLFSTGRKWRVVDWQKKNIDQY
ncbi:MAG: hypothetical protein V4649_11950 [Bacteroidota bacterium]